MSRWTARSSTRGSPTRLRRRFNYFLALTGSQELLIFVRSSGCFNFDSSQYSESTQRAITHTCHMWESRTMTSQINQTGNHRPGPWPSCSHAAWGVKTGQQQCFSVIVHLKYRPLGRCLQSCTSNWIIYKVAPNQRWRLSWCSVLSASFSSEKHPPDLRRTDHTIDQASNWWFSGLHKHRHH